ncbi:MAG: polysaccharide deacetylase family protein [Spirochaetaceae bacterium]|nr:polysaccharide deacetylase family protein [Spirochaetaceae bacterium]
MFIKTIKQKIRKFAGPGLQRVAFSSGIMKLFGQIKKANGAIILMYHSVADASQDRWIDKNNHVPADIFALQMDFLSKNKNVVSLDELISTIQQGKTPESGTVVITFDDGYLDNMTIAAPILDKYNFPATLFLPCGYIDRGENQWIDQVYSFFKFRSKHILKWGTNKNVSYDLKNQQEFQIAYNEVCSNLMTSGKESRNHLLTEIKNQLQPVESIPRLTMNWDDVQTLLSDYTCFNLGGHTIEHTDLTSVTLDEAEIELRNCAEWIKRETSYTANNFSFCYGRTSEGLRHLISKSGFNSACGGDGIDPIITNKTQPYRLPRIAAPATMNNFDLLISTYNTGRWRKLNP